MIKDFLGRRISHLKLRSICNALDIKATITIEDAGPDVPNPIGRTIVAELTGGGATVDEEED